MLFRTRTEKKCARLASAADLKRTASHEDDRNETSEAELRRQLYERIAQAGAIEAVEENTRRHWR